jgi:hypothetical protein
MQPRLSLRHNVNSQVAKAAAILRQRFCAEGQQQVLLLLLLLLVVLLLLSCSSRHQVKTAGTTGIACWEKNTVFVRQAQASDGK